MNAPEIMDAPPLSVYEVTEGEWWIARTREDAIAAACKCWGVEPDSQDARLLFSDCNQLTDLDLDRLRYSPDDDNEITRSFRDELALRVADAGNTFPQFFATSEY